MRINMTEVREYNSKKSEVAIIVGTGNLTADITTRTVETKKGPTVVAGGKVEGKNASQSIALDYREGGEKKTKFYKIEAWGKTAELLGQFGKSGTHMTVVGRHKEVPYTTNDGQDKISEVLVIEYFELSPRFKGENDTTAKPVEKTVPVEEASDFVQIEDDEDLPF